MYGRPRRPDCRHRSRPAPGKPPRLANRPGDLRLAAFRSPLQPRPSSPPPASTALSLRRSEDSFVDELFAAAPECGAPLLAALFPRAYCDVNREPYELDPAMFVDELPPWVNTTSPRVGAGLGTIARVVASGETIYRDKLTWADAMRRIQTLWRPFHETLTALIAGTYAMHGGCLLIDCHSMPSGGQPMRGGRTADFVLGDAHGTSCCPARDSLRRDAR